MLLTIAILGIIAGSYGAWLTWVQLRDEQRRFEKRARLGLGGMAATRKTGGEGLHRAAANARTDDIAHRRPGV